VTGRERRLPGLDRAGWRAGAGLPHFHADDVRGVWRQFGLPLIGGGNDVHDEERGGEGAAAGFEHGGFSQAQGKKGRCSFLKKRTKKLLRFGARRWRSS
jgi:hypothetical protein